MKTWDLEKIYFKMIELQCKEYYIIIIDMIQKKCFFIFLFLKDLGIRNNIKSSYFIIFVVFTIFYTIF